MTPQLMIVVFAGLCLTVFGIALAVQEIAKRTGVQEWRRTVICVRYLKIGAFMAYMGFAAIHGITVLSGSPAGWAVAGL